jgi:putative tricarboxylic transport membrane protein
MTISFDEAIMKERVGSSIFFLLGIYGLVFSTNLPMGKWYEPGPGVFPVFLASLLVLVGIVQFTTAKHEKEEQIEWRALLKSWVTPLKITILTVGFILTLEKIGYLLASCLYIFLLLLWVSRYRLWVASSLAIGIGLASWYLFVKVLTVQLPQGFLS